MENLPKHEHDPQITDISQEFSSMDYSKLRTFIRQKIKEDPCAKFSATLDWKGKETLRLAKACIEDSRLHFDSITIRATRNQYQEEINAFESGVKWEEINE